MNLHPNIAGTVANWRFQGDTKDYSGNGFDLQVVDASTHAPLGAGAISYVAVSNKVNGVVTNDGCLQAVDMYFGDYAGNPVLMGPLSTALQISGPATWEWIGVQKGANLGTYITCTPPTGRSGGSAPDRIGSLYTLFWTTAQFAALSDQHIGSNLPAPGYGVVTTASIPTWAGTNLPVVNDWNAHHFAYVRDASNNWTLYRDGLIKGTVLSAGTNTPLGNEVTFVGRCENGSDGGQNLFASMRIVNYARTATQIAADAAYVLGACGTVATYPVTDTANTPYGNNPGGTGEVRFAADAGRFYRLRPGHMPQLRGN
jgi:hypothetical protein